VVTIIGIALSETYGPSFFLTTNLFSIIVLIALILLSSYGYGFKDRSTIYNAILKADLSAKITKIEKIFGRELVHIFTNGDNFPHSFAMGQFYYSPQTLDRISIKTDFRSPFSIFLKLQGDDRLFETDNQNFLEFKDVSYKFHNDNEIFVQDQFLYAAVNLISTYRDDDDSLKNQIIYILRTMAQIQKASKKKGKLIRRIDAAETYYRLEGPGKWTVCVNCEKILGQWTLKDHITIPQCQSCGQNTSVLLGNSQNIVLDKMKKIKSYV
jgi:hypothetical protein